MSKNQRPRAKTGDYAAMADRAEAEDYTPIDEIDALSTGTSTTPEELAEMLGELDTIEPADSPPTPAGAPDNERATDEDLGDLTSMGRPSLSGRQGLGPSPKRQVRLPRDLDAALTERTQTEHRGASDIIRDALTEYLPLTTGGRNDPGAPTKPGAQRFVFTVSIDIEHEAGKFIKHAALAEELQIALESAQDDVWRGIDVEDSTYQTKSWVVRAVR